MLLNILKQFQYIRDTSKIQSNPEGSRGLEGVPAGNPKGGTLAKFDSPHVSRISKRQNHIGIVTQLKRIIVSLYEKLHGTSLKGEQHGRSTHPSLVNRSSIFIAEEPVTMNVVNSLAIDTDQDRHVISQHSQCVQSSTLVHDSDSQTGYEDETLLVPDLSGQVVRTRADAVFVGNYSLIFIGEWDGRTVAIKVIREVGTVAATRRKIHREREVWARLKHDNVVPLYGFCEGHEEFGKYGALISPWYNNGDAAQYVRRNSVPAPQRFKLWVDIIQGMVYLHSHNPILVHGDLKPMNVLIDDDGRARICDFGLVRVLSDDTTGFGTTTTHTGTVRYLAYELVVSEHPVPTVASDVHALGCVGLDLIFLTSPYANRKTHAQIFGDIGRGVPPATEIPINISNESLDPIYRLWDTLNSCWNIAPGGRPSVHELQDFVRDHGDENMIALEDGIEASFRT